MKWRLAVPSVGLTAVVTPVFPDQELDTARSTQVIYWEGAVRAEAAVAGRPVRGKGYRIAAVRLFPGSGETPGDYFGVPCLAVRSPREFARGLQVAARARGPVAIEAHVDGSLYPEILYGAA